MHDAYTQIGVGGILAVLIIREVLGFLKGHNPSTEIEKMRHNELKNLIKVVNENISAQTALLREMCREILDLKGKIK